MSGIEAAGLVLGIISAIISIIDATHQVYKAVKDEAGLPTNFKKSATKLPLISKLLGDAETYVKASDEATRTAFTPTLEDCKSRAIQIQELFNKVMPKEGESRWDRYVKAARTIGKGGHVENLVGGILDDLQFLATRYPEVTSLRTKEQLAKAVEEVTSADSRGNVYFQVPRTVNSLFTGRTELLSRIQTVFLSDTSFSKKQRRFVITGMGGQGKSEICLQVADLLKDEYIHFKKLSIVY